MNACQIAAIGFGKRKKVMILLRRSSWKIDDRDLYVELPKKVLWNDLPILLGAPDIDDVDQAVFSMNDLHHLEQQADPLCPEPRPCRFPIVVIGKPAGNHFCNGHGAHLPLNIERYPDLSRAAFPLQGCHAPTTQCSAAVSLRHGEARLRGQRMRGGDDIEREHRNARGRIRVGVIELHRAIIDSWHPPRWRAARLSPAAAWRSALLRLSSAPRPHATHRPGAKAACHRAPPGA